MRVVAARYLREVEPPLTDAEVIARSHQDPEAFGTVFERHHERIFRYVARRVGRDRAVDLTADVFLTAFRTRARYDPARASFAPWLYGIATNIVGDEIRKRRLRDRKYLAVSVLSNPADQGHLGSEARLDAQAVGADLNRALSSLHRADRDVLLLYAIEQLSYREVAEALDIPIGTVRSRLARARRRIGELIPDLEQRIGEGGENRG